MDPEVFVMKVVVVVVAVDFHGTFRDLKLSGLRQSWFSWKGCVCLYGCGKLSSLSLPCLAFGGGWVNCAGPFICSVYVANQMYPPNGR